MTPMLDWLNYYIQDDFRLLIVF